MLTSNQIRQGFIDYFVKQHAHVYAPSSPVVPQDDPTLLFTNAGMNQFKDVFLAVGSRDFTRAVNTQKCIRAGGKHNDLQDVGKDTYHHTFFEMLGNWSFGDYFKKEAIAWAWQLLTEVWGLDKALLHATVFKGDPTLGLDPDEQAAELWRTVTDIDPSHIHYGDKKDNFWEMGDTGPCGPCSEIHVDLTPDRSGGKRVNADDARVIEIWNLVFIQYNRNANGDLTPLPAKHVDTGMGFERICAVLQGVDSNYDTDIFTPIFTAIAQATGRRPYNRSTDKTDTAYRIIADHIRCLTFALTDGAVPSNEGRGYVLRRILRRAARHGRQTLGVNHPFLHQLVPAVVDTMAQVFPELTTNPQHVAEIIRDEESAFGKTLDRGIALFQQTADLGGNQVSADAAFKLHDTYGFPLDLTQVMAEERGLTVDVKGFEQRMASARTQARAAGGGGASGGGEDLESLMIQAVQRDKLPPTEFLGYDQIDCKLDTPVWVYDLDGTPAIVTQSTPFYAQSGGQAGDHGHIQFADATRFHVLNTLKVGTVFFHTGQVTHGQPKPSTSQTLHMTVDRDRRARIMANHTGTHLMNRALRDVLGPHVQQKGSLVEPNRLRFDFSHNHPVTAEQIDRVEQLVNTDIASDLPVYTENAPEPDARKINTLRAVFGEKYPDVVRVVSIGAPIKDLLAAPDDPRWMTYSVEFCGGTHLTKTGDAEGFVIVTEQAVAKGVRRLAALTGEPAHQAAAIGDMLLARAKTIEALPPDQLAANVTQLAAQLAETLLPLIVTEQLRTQLANLRDKLKEQAKQRTAESSGRVVDDARRVADESDGRLIVAAMNADANALRTAMDVIRKKRPDAAMLLGGATEHDLDKVAFVAVVPKPMIEKGLKAGDWVREVAKVAGGGGGGRPDMAQAGGKHPAKLHEALEVGRRFAESKL